MEYLSFHWFLRMAHIALGCGGLILFWLAALSPKGGSLHRRSGRYFFASSLALAATAAVSSLWAIAAPISFSGINRELSLEDSTLLVNNIRFLFVILFTLMTWLVSRTVSPMPPGRELSQIG